MATSAIRHGVTGLAAESAFFGSLALFPSVLTLVAILNAFRPAFGADAAPYVTSDLARLLRVVLTARGSVAADSAGTLLDRPSSGLIGVSTVVSVLFLARGIRSIRRGLDVISGEAPLGPVAEWRRAFLIAAVVLLGMSTMLAAFVLGPLLGHRRSVGGELTASAVGEAWIWGRWPVCLAMLLGYAVVLISTHPPWRRQTWRATLRGAAVTVVGWVVATAILPVYVAFAGQVSPTFGALGGGLIVLLWVYLLHLSIFVGAEINLHRYASACPGREQPTA